MASRPSDGNQNAESNRIVRHADSGHGGMCVKQYRPKPFDAKMIKYRLAAKMGKTIPVEYRCPAERRDFEEACLRLWQAKGYAVPAVKPVPVDFEQRGPCLGMEQISGERLDHYLTSPARGQTQRLAILKTVFDDMRKRHCLAIFENEHRLIHYDSNLRNVIIQDGRPVHIDFEMGHLEEDIDRSAAREVLKLSLAAANVLGREQVSAIATLLVADYGIIHVVKRIVKEILGAPLQAIHRLRDRRRKRRKPGLVTKYDLAEAIDEALTGERSKTTAGTGDPRLVRALETSWDGKFYQSLDDADPRGRDMHHRYRIMQFPESFEGASVLDIGCNIGRICVDARKRGAGRVAGIDFRRDVIAAMGRYYRDHGIDVNLCCADINQGLEPLKAMIGDAPFDYVFVLSIWSHVDQKKLWEIINHYAGRVVLFEDNAPSRVRSLDRIRSILSENLAFEEIAFLGFTTDRGVRAVFRLTGKRAPSSNPLH